MNEADLKEDLDALMLMVTRRFDNVIRRLHAAERTLAGIDERQTLLDEKVDGVCFDIDRLLTGFARLKQRVAALEARP